MTDTITSTDAETPTRTEPWQAWLMVVGALLALAVALAAFATGGAALVDRLLLAARGVDVPATVTTLTLERDDTTLYLVGLRYTPIEPATPTEIELTVGGRIYFTLAEGDITTLRYDRQNPERLALAAQFDTWGWLTSSLSAGGFMLFGLLAAAIGLNLLRDALSYLRQPA